MKRISMLLLIILIFNTSLITIKGNTVSEYQADKIYDSSAKIIIDDGEVVPVGANILLFDNNNKKIISIDKNLMDYYDKYEFIGYELNNMPFIYKGSDEMLKEKIYPIKNILTKFINNIEEIFVLERPKDYEYKKVEPTTETTFIMISLGIITLFIICFWMSIEEKKVN